jgi:cytochrome c556
LQIEKENKVNKFLVSTFVLAAAWVGALVAQTITVATVEDHDRAMKTISMNARQVPKLLEANALDEVKKRYEIIRGQFAGVAGFWASKKNADAVMLTNNANAKVDAIVKAIDASDRPGIDASIKELVAACAACHNKYREPDPATPNSFVIRKEFL